MEMRKSVVVCLLIGLLTIVGPTTAWSYSEPDDEGHGESSEHAGSSNDEDHSSDEHGAYKNSLGVFLGVTDEPGHDVEGTWGVEYTRIFNEKWGIGAVAEYAGGELRNTVVILFAAWAPWKNLEVFGGPGVENHDGRSSETPHEKSAGEGEIDEDETYFVFRVGAGWHVHLSHRVGLVPAVYLDLVDGEKVWVYGFNLTYWF